MYKLNAIGFSDKNYSRLAIAGNQVINNCLHLGAWLAGGAVRSIFDSTPIQDYDLYFKDKNSAMHVEKYLQDIKAKIIFQCPVGELTTYQIGNCKIQCIKLFYPTSIENLFNEFDFSICQFAYDGIQLYFTKQAIKDAKKKRLSLVKITKPISTMVRLNKYIAKGYYVPDSTYKALVEAHHMLHVHLGNALEFNINVSIDWRRYVD